MVRSTAATHQERHRDRDLRDHQSVADEAPRSWRRADALPQCRRRGGYERRDRGHHPEEERRHHRDADRKSHHPGVERDVQIRGRPRRPRARNHYPHQHRRADSRADDAKDPPIEARSSDSGQYLPHHPETPSAEQTPGLPFRAAAPPRAQAAGRRC